MTDLLVAGKRVLRSIYSKAIKYIAWKCLAVAVLIEEMLGEGRSSSERCAVALACVADVHSKTGDGGGLSHFDRSNHDRQLAIATEEVSVVDGIPSIRWRCERGDDPGVKTNAAQLKRPFEQHGRALKSIVESGFLVVCIPERDKVECSELMLSGK